MLYDKTYYSSEPEYAAGRRICVSSCPRFLQHPSHTRHLSPAAQPLIAVAMAGSREKLLLLI